MSSVSMAVEPEPGPENSGSTDARLEATLGISQEVARGQAVQVRFTLTNHTQEELRVLRWYTPLEGFAGDIFDVERDGEPVPYRGILAKRSVPQPEEYVTIAPGESVSAEVDLAAGYDLATPGDYDVQYRSPEISQVVSKQALMAKSQGALGPVQIPSNKVSVRIVDTGESGPAVLPMAPMAEEAKEEHAKTVTYDDCSTTEEATVKSADLTALKRATSIYTHLKNLSLTEQQTDPLYKTWFGAHTATRYSKVLGNWKKIRDGFEEDITYNCSGPECQPSYYAYVYAGGKQEVFLCEQFWGASTTGTDTQYGILIHEVSHEVAGTNDHGYGLTTCKAMATNEPEKAIENADNYEFFAEHYEPPERVGPRHLLPTLLLAGGVLVAECIRRVRKWRSEA